MKRISFVNFFRYSNFVFFIVFLSFLLKILWLPQNLFFGFEQGRDLFVVKEIVENHDLRLLGPPTDLAEEGIYHGVLYYYLLVPFYLIGRGDPFVVTLGLVVLNLVGIIFLYKETEKFFDKRTAIFATLFVACSYSSVIYSRWLSNPTPIFPTLALLIYFLALARQNSRYLIGSALCFGAIIHFSLATASTLILPIIGFLLIWRIRISKWLFVLCSFSILIFFLPYIIFDFRHNSMLSSSFLKIFYSLSGRAGEENVINQIIIELTDSIFPRFIIASLIFILIIIGINLWLVIFKVDKNLKSIQTFLFFLFGSSLLFLIFNIHPARHIFVTLSLYFSILLAYAINILFQKYGKNVLIVPIVLIVINVFMLIPVLKNGVSFLYNSQRTYLGEMKQVIDYIYLDAGGERFSYNYFTVPWWRPEAWQYLFSWYGKSKYGYEPEINQTKVFYVIIEPDLTSRSVYKDNWYGEFKKDKLLLDSKKFDWLTVEKRTLN